MTDTTKTHFTAVIEITKTTVTPPPVRTSYNPPPPEREVSQVIHVVLRDETLDQLKTKINRVLEAS